jgi:hypothetical protein
MDDLLGNFPEMIKMAHKMATSAAGSISENEKEQIKNMDEASAVEHVTKKVMGLMSNFNNNEITDITDYDNIVLTVKMKPCDFIDGVTDRKIKYKRLVCKKMVKERVLFSIEKMSFKNEITFPGKGDADGDLILKFTIEECDGVQVTSQGDIIIEQTEENTGKNEEITFESKFKCKLKTEVFTSEDGLLLDNKTRGSVTIKKHYK